MENEIWRDILEYEGLYQVSNLGRVKSLKQNKELILKPRTVGPENKRYLEVVLYKNNKAKAYRVHQLVAIAFLNHVPNGHKTIVNHLDENKLNNNLENLEITTNRKNISYSKDKTKTSSKYLGVYYHKPNKKWLSRIRINGKYKHLGYFSTEGEAGLAYQKELNKLERTTTKNSLL